MISSANSMPSSETRLLIERLIGEVAERHNVLIGAEDPIFISVTLNERLLAETVARLKTEIVASQNLIAAGTAEQLAAAKTLGGRLVTAAAGHVAAEMRATAAEVAEMVRHAMIAELDEMRANVAKVQEIHAAIRWAAIIAIAAAAFALAIAIALPLLATVAPG